MRIITAIITIRALSWFCDNRRNCHVGRLYIKYLVKVAQDSKYHFMETYLPALCFVVNVFEFLGNHSYKILLGEV